jgi:arsenate reductase
MTKNIYNVLFLCTGNSCRSILAESILNRIGQGRFKGYSAGSHPVGEVNPYTIELLQRFDHATEELRSKSWDEFASANAPEMDFVVTVCDQAAGEVCPVWPGKPATAHWSFPDPAKFEGTELETRNFFSQVYGQINKALAVFVNLPIQSLDENELKKKLAEIGDVISQRV